MFSVIYKGKGKDGQSYTAIKAVGLWSWYLKLAIEKRYKHVQ